MANTGGSNPPNVGSIPDSRSHKLYKEGGQYYGRS